MGAIIKRTALGRVLVNHRVERTLQDESVCSANSSNIDEYIMLSGGVPMSLLSDMRFVHAMSRMKLCSCSLSRRDGGRSPSSSPSPAADSTKTLVEHPPTDDGKRRRAMSEGYNGGTCRATRTEPVSLLSSSRTWVPIPLAPEISVGLGNQSEFPPAKQRYTTPAYGGIN